MEKIAARVLESWPPRLGRWQRLSLSVAAAVVGFVAVLATMVADTELAMFQVLALALTIGIAVAVAMRAPEAGWALGLAALTAASVFTGVQAELWVDPMLTSYFVVLGVGAVRAGARAAAGIWVATVATGVGLALWLRPAEWLVGILGASAVSGLVLSTVIAIRTVGVTSTSLRRERDSTERQRQLTSLWEERARIARELHDVVAHHMTVIAIQAEAAQHSAPDLAATTSARLDTIRTSATVALTEMRHILGVLRSGDATLLPQPTLRDLTELVETVRGGGTRVTMTLTGDTTTAPDAVGLSTYRIVQEALSNAIRHAPGAPVDVTVAVTDEAIDIRVTNPCTPTPATGAGHGLLGMRERATMLGGTFTAGADATKYVVAASLPLHSGRVDTARA
ncbi:sensor histidine kinase [Nocardia caishijiensis]|uniref:histidine kinase n=1 Tax=Nocardia caishijiensis TaxID=184756 RepID=A0ABQ6YQL0_9NOCA|nr:histidine kinase [Nocardia caishijiensis]KAF0847741.1 signal transduction histidine kinase [Nocardia caishijiensis]